MPAPYDVCIRGAGVVGSTLALLLARDRLRIALAGPSPSPAEPARADVRAYALNAASRRLLQALRCWPDEAATPVLRMEVHGDGGGRLQFDAKAQDAEALAWIVDVPALEARLADAVRYQPQVERVEAAVPAPLTAICEGRTSRTRDELGVAFRVRTYPQRAIAARFESTVLHQGTARQWFAADGVLALLPLDVHGLALVWSVDAARADALLALPATEFADAVATAAGLPAGSLVLAGERAHWPLQRAEAERWSGRMPGAAPRAGTAAPGWVLAGDAAHTVHPLAGQGLNLGLGDAAELAARLHGRDYWRSVADPRVLRGYERARKAALQPLGWATDGLQQLFAAPAAPIATLRNAGLRAFDAAGPLKRWVAAQAAGG